MHILAAFEQMLGGLCGGDAPSWQIDQIIIWEDKVRWAVTCADIADADARTLSVLTGESAGLPAWHISCLRFLRCLQAQERTAGRLYAEETRAAAESERTAAAVALEAGGPRRQVDNANRGGDRRASGEADAGRHREEAAKHRALASAYEDWLIAARDARVYGTRMLTGALPRHQDAASGLAAAGGAAEVYKDTRWAVKGRPAGRGAVV